METLEKVTVRLSAETIRLLQELVDKGEWAELIGMLNQSFADN